MPRYDYKCESKSCQHTFEADQKITEDKLTTCPKCQKESLVRLIGKTSFHLKGPGWYSDGYSKENKSE